MKTIVTHLSPDLDAICSCWLIKKYLPGWKNAVVKFVPAGLTLDKGDPDKNPEILHVDTGMGKFDHHQTDAYTSASLLVFRYLDNKKFIGPKDIESLDRLINLVTEFDHFHEFFYPDPSSDRYNLLLHETVEGLKKIISDEYILLDISFKLLDATLLNLKNKLSAEKEIKKGYEFASRWGKSLIISTGNSEVGKLAMKIGYHLIISKNKEKGYVQAKCPPLKDLDLTSLYEKLKSADPKASWFLHSSKHMILNGSAKNPAMRASSLSIPKLIEIVRNI